MGCDYTDVKDFIEDKGLPIYDHEIARSNLQNP